MSNLSKILVLGSNSFTAGYLIQHVLQSQKDCSVVAISRSPQVNPVMSAYLSSGNDRGRVEFRQLSVNHQASEIVSVCDKFKPEYIFNFAAQGEVRNSWKWPDQWYETNCMGVVRLTSALVEREYLKKYVVSSTPEVYGSTGEGMTESTSFEPSTPYAASKLAGDLHLGVLNKRYQFPVVFTRAANVYGPHQQLYRIIPRTVVYAKCGRKINLHGGGKSRRAFIHAHDVADATWKAAEKGVAGEVYHLSPNNDMRTVRSVVETVLQQMGEPFEKHVEMQDENYGQDDCFSLNSSKAQQELKWSCQVPFEEGVEQVIKWVNDNWAQISKMNLEYVHQP